MTSTENSILMFDSSDGSRIITFLKFAFSININRKLNRKVKFVICLINIRVKICKYTNKFYIPKM